MPLKLNRTLYTVNADMNTKASVDSPTLAGTPTAPTPSVGDNSAKVATTEFVNSMLVTSVSKLLRITTFRSSGTWVKQPGVTSVLVEVVGGGGGGADFNSFAGNGGTSSFGSHVSATGGQGGDDVLRISVGGTGINGDINISGKNSSTINAAGAAGSGDCYIGTVGLGGYGDSPSRSGGGGGYAKKLINSSTLNSSETVTVGAGGIRGAGGEININGYPGIVIIYEYGY